MASSDNLSRTIKVGESLKPWILLGAFNHSVSDKVIGLSYFEDKTTQVGRTAMNEIVEEARSILALTPSEGDSTTFHGEMARWNLVRGPEKYISWGTYNI